MIRPGTIRARIIVLVLFATLPAFLTLFHLESSEREEALERGQGRALSLARIAADQQLQRFRTAGEMLEVLAEVPAVSEAVARPGAADPLLASLLQSRPWATNIFLLDPEGHLVGSATPLPGAGYSERTPGLGDRAYYQRALASAGYHVGEHGPAGPGDGSSLVVARSIRRGSGEAVAVAAVSLDLEWLGRLPVVSDLPAGSHLLVLDRKGTVLAHAPEAAGWAGAPLAADVRTRLLAGAPLDGTAPVTGLGEFVHALVPVGSGSEHDALVYVGIPSSEIVAGVRSRLERSVAILLAVAGGTLLLAVGLGERLVARRLTRLAATAGRLGRGDLTARLGADYDAGEVGDVERALDRMAGELQQRDEQLRGARERLGRLLEEMPAGFYEASGADGETLLYASPRFRDLLGGGGDPWRDAIHPEDRARARRERAAAVASAGLFRVEFRVAAGGGEEMWVAEHGVVEILPDGGGRLVRGYVEDVSESRRVEESLRASRRLDTAGMVASAVYREFDEILASIAAQCRAAPAEGGPAGARLRAIETATERGAELTQRLARLGGAADQSGRVLDVNAVVRGIERVVRRVLGPEVELDVRLAPVDLRCRMGRGLLDQVLLHLVLHARDSVSGAGRVTVETAEVDLDDRRARACGGLPPGSYVEIAVGDCGLGPIGGEEAALLDPFAADRIADRAWSLTLATVQGIVRQAGGALVAGSLPEGGSVIRALLPRAARDPDEPTPMPVEWIEPRTPGTVLVVVPDESLRLFVQGALEGALEGDDHLVVAVADGASAVRAAEAAEGPVALLLVALGLPDGSGRDVARQIRALRPGTRVIFLTGFADPDAGADTDPRGATYLSRPLTPGALTRAVRRALSPPV